MKAKFLAAVLILSALFVTVDKSCACPNEPPNQNPIADLTAEPEYVLLGNSVTLDGSGSYDPDGYITKYEWDFNYDDSFDPNHIETYPDSDGNTTHTYGSAGTYTVMLRVTDDDGATDTDTCTVYVNVKIFVPSDVNTIQGAIDISTDGLSTIVVSRGRYYEDIDFKGKAITLTSTDPNNPNVVNATIIDGNDSVYHVVTFETSEDANSVLRGFTITGGNANGSDANSYGGGIYCFGASPTITNCTIANNNSEDDGGGMYCTNSAPTITNCTFSGNETYGSGYGGGMYNLESSPNLTNCTFNGNSTDESGGGMYNNSSNPTLTNCTFNHNAAQYTGMGGFYKGGGGMYNEDSSPNLINCTFSKNSTTKSGGGMYNFAYDGVSSPNVTNCIFWGNSGSGGQIYGGTPVVNYSCIQGGWTGAGGTGNIDSDPFFVDANNPDGDDGIFATLDDGLQLQIVSPCIDAADGNKAPLADITGRIRVDVSYVDNNGTGDPNYADIGAYESPMIWFVDNDATGSNNGNSWDNAFIDLQYALAEANEVGEANDGCYEIWVADGNYTPTSENDRSISFQLVEGVGVYGGFDGNEVGHNQRDWTAYPTTLSGDINDIGNPNDNSYHVVKGADRAVLDGFTITGGNADGSYVYRYDSGGGIYYDDTSPTISNCTITGNDAQYGGGMGTWGRYTCSPIIINCFFNGNTAEDYGGGMLNLGGSVLTLINCVFSGNSAGLDGGGIYGSPHTITNCTFTENSAGLYGGGMSTRGSSTITNCIFWGNDANGSGNEIYNSASADPNFSYCDIEGCKDSNGVWDPNFGNDDGGNIDSDPCFVDPCTPAGSDGIFGTLDDGLRLPITSPCVDAADGDAAPSADVLGLGRADINDVNNTGTGSPDYVDIGAYEFISGAYNTTQDILYNTIQAAIDGANDGDTIEVFGGRYYENIDFKGKGIALTSTDPNNPNIVNATIIDANYLSSYVVRFENSEGSDSVITGFTITGSYSDGIYCSGSSPTISNCEIRTNSDNGIYCNSSSSPAITDCTITNNSSYGLYCNSSSSPSVTNCTISNNNYGLYCRFSSSPTVTDCSITNNSNHGVYCRDSSSPVISNCEISANQGYGLYLNASGVSIISDCAIIGNNSYGVYAYGDITLSNCVIAKTKNSSWGVRVWSGTGTFRIINCTIVDNTTYGIYGYADEVTNCIVWGNGDDLYLYGGVTATYSCIENGDSGVGNFSEDPRFVDADSNDFHLDSNSVCIDTGSPCSDYSKELSPNGGRINIGAYGNTPEAATTTDVDGDGISDNWERYYWPGDDPNQHDPNDDTEQDGFSNWVEYLFGYDPNAVTTEGMEVRSSGAPFTTSGFYQIDPTKGQAATIKYILNMDADAEISFIKTNATQPVWTINQTNVIAGVMKQAVWDGTDDGGMIVESYFYDVKIDANDGDGNWTSPDRENTDYGTLHTDYYKVDSNDFDPYKNIPVIIKCKMNDWNTRKIDVVKDGHVADYFEGNDIDRIYHLVRDRLLSPGWNTFYWYGRWGTDVNDPNNNPKGKVCEEAFDVYFEVPDNVNKGIVLVYYEEVLANLRCNPYRILPLADEVTTITYDLACAANVTIDTYDPDGNYFGTLSEQQQSEPQEVIWYGTTRDPNDPNSRYISTEGVYRIEVQCDKTTETLGGSITVYK